MAEEGAGSGWRGGLKLLDIAEAQTPVALRGDSARQIGGRRNTHRGCVAPKKRRAEGGDAKR